MKNENVKYYVLLGMLMLCFAFVSAPYLEAKTEWSDKTFQVGIYKGYVSKDGKTCCLTEMIVTDSTKKVVIPSEINGMKVIKLARKTDEHIAYKNLFSNDFDEPVYDNNKSKIETIVIPNTVTEISDQVFCLLPKLNKIKLSNNLKSLGEDVFTGDKKLKEISIPASLISINNHAFEGASSLRKVIINPKNKKYSSTKSGIFSKNGNILYMVIGNTGNLYMDKRVTKIYGYKNTGTPALRGRKGYALSYYSDKINHMIHKGENFNLVDYPNIANHKVTFSPKNKVFGKKKNCIYSKKTGELLYYIKNNKKLQIAEGIKKITKQAMWSDGTEYENKIYLPSTLKHFDFWSLPMEEDYLSDIYFSSAKPPKIVGNILLKKSLKGIRIHVPKKSVKAYKKKFKNLPVKVLP